MRQIKLASPGGLNNLNVVEVDKPIAKAGQVIIKVAASSLNYHDLLVALGQIQPKTAVWCSLIVPEKSLP